MAYDVQGLRTQWAALVQERRTKKGLSQTRLARIAGVEKQRISKIELAQIATSDTVLFKIANGLDVSVSTLLEELAARLDQPAERIAS